MSSEERERVSKLLEPAYRGEAVALPKGTSIDSRIFREHVAETVEHSNNSGRPALRWIIHNAIFIGHLDLSDGRTGGGGSLPAIEFHNCEFRAGFCASAAHIERLCFESCEFTANDKQANVINLRNVRISTELCFENLRPHATENAENEPGLLWVDGFASTVGANVVLKRTVLRAPRNESSSLGHDARYALDLATATIGSDLLMQPAVVLEGGLKIRDARIGGSLWGQALHVTDGETETTRKAILDRGETARYGIFGQSVVVKGVLSLSSDWHRRSEGQIPESLINIEPDDLPDPMRFWCMGDVNFLGAHIGDNLDLGGAKIRGDLWLNGAGVGGTCSAQKNVIPLVFQRLRRTNPWMFSLEAAIFSMESCRIGADCLLDVNVQELRLDGSVIEGKLAVSGKAIKVSAPGQKVDRDAEFALIVKEQCNLGGAKLKGRLDLSWSEFAKGVLSIRDAEIGHSFILTALYQKVDSVQRRPLTCYPGYILSEVALPRDSDENALLEQSQKRFPRVVSFLTRKRQWRGLSHGRAHIVLLNGQSAPFHLLNERGFLQLRTEDQAKEYLRLFCAFTWADEGSFSLVEQDSQLPARFRGKIPVHPLRRIESMSSSKAAFAFEVHIRYGLALRKVKFALRDNGLAEMLEDAYVTVDDELVAYLSNEIPTYLPPFRAVADLTTPSEFMSDATVVRGTKAKRDFLAEVPNWSERTVRDRVADTEVDLRDTTCGILCDNAGRIWEKSRVVSLEGFSYAGTFMPKESSVEGEVDIRRFWLRGRPHQTRWQQAWAALVRFLYVVGLLQLLNKISWGKYAASPGPENPFRAQPYAQLAKVLRDRGDDQAARDVEADSIYWGAYDRALKSPGGWFFFVFWWTPYGLFFRFGLAPIRAFLTLVLVWFVGFAAISMLSESKMLNANITAVASVAHGPTAVVPSATKDYVKSLPCGEAIAPALYAAELLTPIFNLHQESRCDIASSGGTSTPLTLWGRPFPHPEWMEEPRLWEYLKALYIVLGSIVSSLALLTFSGIARRWEH